MGKTIFRATATAGRFGIRHRFDSAAQHPPWKKPIFAAQIEQLTIAGGRAPISRRKAVSDSMILSPGASGGCLRHAGDRRLLRLTVIHLHTSSGWRITCGTTTRCVHAFWSSTMILISAR
jgi:hypothetical protein